MSRASVKCPSCVGCKRANNTRLFPLLKTPTPRPKTPTPSVRKLLIYGQIMLANKIYYTLKLSPNEIWIVEHTIRHPPLKEV